MTNGGIVRVSNVLMCPVPVCNVPVCPSNGELVGHPKYLAKV